MTLILSCVTQKAAVQVADRRLVRVDGAVHDDGANKMTLFDGRIAFSYTGLALLNGQRTDLWLRDLLNRPECTSADKAIQSLKATATDTLRNIKAPTRFKRLAFVGIGWSLLAQHRRPVPLICRVSNFHREDGSMSAHALNEFRADSCVIRANQPLVFIATGECLPLSLAAKCRWLLRHHVKKNSSYSKLIAVLVGIARECAETKRSVGKNLLSAVIPRDAISRETPFIVTRDGPPSRDLVSFRTWPADKDLNAVYHANYAGPRPVVSNFQAGTLGSGGISFTDNSVIITYPCFYISNEARTALLTRHSGGLKCLAVYTECDVVETMNVVSGVKGVLHQIESPEQFAALLQSVASDFQGVCFNPTIEGKTRTATIESMMRALTKP